MNQPESKRRRRESAKKKKKNTWQDAAQRVGSSVSRASDAGVAPLAPRPCFPGRQAYALC